MLTGFIGVAATLLGSFTTYLFQSRTAERFQGHEREERLRQEQLDACATAMTELKRSLVTLWFYRQRDARTADYLAARIEGDRLGASAEAARFRLQLVTGDPRLVRLADAAFTAVGAISDFGYAAPATPIRLPSGSVKCPTTSPDGARSGPITRLPPSRSARCRAASTSATPT